MNAAKLIGAGGLVIVGYGVYRLLSTPAFVPSPTGGIKEPVEGKDFEVVRGSGIPDSDLAKIKDKEYQIRQVPGKVAARLRRHVEFMENHMTPNLVAPAVQTYGSSGLSDKQLAGIRYADTQHEREKLHGAGKVIGDLGR